MATDRFVRLPKEKQEIILWAAIREFAQVPFDKVSINKIIKEADISRGSFYTYFEDKKDVLHYIIMSTLTQYKNAFQSFLKKNKGDIWETLEDLLDYSISSCFKHGLFDFFRNITLYGNSDDMLGEFFRDSNVEDEGQKLGRWVYDNIDKSMFKIQRFDDFALLMDVAMSSMMMALRSYYREEKSLDQVKIEFHRKLEMLRHGVCKSNVLQQPDIEPCLR